MSPRPRRRSRKKKKPNPGITITDANSFFAAFNPINEPLNPLMKAGLRLQEIESRQNRINEIQVIVEGQRINYGYYTDPSRGIHKQYSSRAIKSLVTKAATRLAKDQIAMQQLIAEQESATATQVEKRKGIHAGDGNCYISCVNMGLGDCTLITSPGGVRFMIDLGSDSLTDAYINPNSSPKTDKQWDQKAKNLIRDEIQSTTFLDTANVINFLILTHTDADHHNKLDLLNQDVRFGRVYYSSLLPSYSSSNIIRQKTGNNDARLKPITLKQNQDGSVTRSLSGSTQIPTYPRTATPHDPYDSEYIDQYGRIVLYQENGNDFTVSILSSNVNGAYTDKGVWQTNDANIKETIEGAGQRLNGSDPNKGSVVTMIEFNGKRALIMGDATAVTEYFIVQQYRSQGMLLNPDLVRIGHHASPTSSSGLFVNALNMPSEVVASTTGKYTKLHGLPKWSILKLYESRGNAIPHNIYAFDEGHHTKNQHITSKRLYATGSNGSHFVTFSKF